MSFNKFELIDPLSLRADSANYEFLRGGTGKDINYRQERYRVDLLKEVDQLNPRIVSDIFEGDMVDFAITGVSCWCPGRVTANAGTVVPKVWVMLGDETYYSGRARLSHVRHREDSESGEESTVVGLQLLDDVIDIDRILRLRTSAETRNEMKATAVTLSRQDITTAYKSGIADLVFLLTRHRSLLARFERHLAEAGPIAQAELETEMLESAWAMLKSPLFRIQDQLDDLTREHYFDRDFQELYRQYTIPQLSPHICVSPFSRRAWLKPLGYPGDYILMCYLYDCGWEGNSMFEKLLHQYPMYHQMADAVRNRKVLAGRLYEEVLAGRTNGSSEPVRIFALAAGPAREVVDFVASYDGERKVEFILVDQDNRALGYVAKQLAPLLVKRRGIVSVQYLYVALRQLIEDPALFGTIPPVDLIFSAGLFDYLSTGKGKLLMSKLFEKLRPGGTVVVGNYGSPPHHAWLPTYVYDWPLRYRTREEMRDLAQGLEEGAGEIEVLHEETRKQYFTRVVKRNG